MSGGGDQARHRAGLDKWLKINADYAKIWPNITVKKDRCRRSQEMDGVEGKFEQFFSENPARATDGVATARRVLIPAQNSIT